jgi:ketosteroid isomerase-like protein
METSSDKAQARRLLEEVFASLLDPAQDVEALGRYFSEDYVQHVDGVRLDRRGFLDHARTLKKSLLGGRVTIESLLADGPIVADIHVVEARKTGGETVRMRVFAFYRIEDGRIASVDELTHLLHGAASDRDLGSRVSHETGHPHHPHAQEHGAPRRA